MKTEIGAVALDIPVEHLTNVQRIKDFNGQKMAGIP